MADLKRVQEATAYLITAPRHRRLVSEIWKAVEEHETNPRAFTGALEPLNAMIELGLESPKGLQRVFDLIRDKRDLSLKLKRNNYQREFMIATRERQRKAAELQELVRGSPFPTTADRNRHMNEAQTRWRRALAERLANAGPLTWWERVEETRKFWASIDETLDGNLATARASAAAKVRKTKP